MPATNIAAAVALSIGIGLQNFPEGVAVAMPLRSEGMSRGKSFWYGQLSAAVEPVAAVIGATAVVLAAPILPYALSFAAGAMVYVVVEVFVGMLPMWTVRVIVYKLKHGGIKGLFS